MLNAELQEHKEESIPAVAVLSLAVAVHMCSR